MRDLLIRGARRVAAAWSWWLLAGLLGAAGAAQAQGTAALITAWTTAGCNACHGTPAVSSSTATNRVTPPATAPFTEPLQYILDHYQLGAPALSSSTTIATNMRSTCSNAAHSGNYMCTLNSGSISARTDQQLVDAYNYLYAARHGVATATAPGKTATVAKPHFSVADDATLAFDGAAPNATSATTWTVTVENLRSVAVNLSLSSSNSEFRVVSGGSCLTGVSTTAGQVAAASAGAAGSCSFDIAFQPGPASSGGRNGTLTMSLASTIPAGEAVPSNPAQRVFTLSGTALVGTAAYAATTASFSSAVGTPSVVALGTVSNTGNADYTVSAITFASPVTPNPYTLPSGASLPAGGCKAGTVVTTASPCTLYVSFLPTSAVAYSGATASIAHGGSNSPFTTSTFSGSGLQGTLALTGPVPPFGTVNQGSTSGGTVTVTNSGSSPVSGLVYTVAPSTEFTRTGGSCGSTLSNVGGSNTCTLDYTYRPLTSPVLAPDATLGSSATLTVTSTNAANAPSLGLAATAKGLRNPSASTPSAFTATPVGTTNATPAIITVSNPRPNAVTYSFTGSSAIRSSDVDAGDFAVTAEQCSATRSIPGGGSCTFTVTFTPGVPRLNNPRTGHLDLNFAGSGTDPAPPSIAVLLQGTTTTSPTISPTTGTITVSAPVGGSASGSFVISNTGTAPLALTSVGLASTGFPGDYVLGGTCTSGASIPGRVPPAAASTCLLSVTFTPGAEGARGAAVSIVHTATGSPMTVTLDGTGTASLAAVLDTGGTTALDFGDVKRGASATRTLTVRNGNTTGGASALVLSGLSFSGATADYTRGGDCTPTTSLASGQSCSLSLTFAPTTAGTRAATLAIASNAGTRNLDLTGNGLALDDMVLTPDTNGAFPATLTGTTSTQSRTVTLTNPRTNAVTYTPAISGTNAADFSIAAESCASRSIGAGQSCTVRLSFAPASGAAGARGATLGFSFTGAGTDPAPAAASTALSGTAMLPAPTFGITSSALTFTTVLGTPTTASAVITNTGTAALTLSALSVAGTSSAEFALASGNGCSAGASLAPAQSCTLVVGYTPATVGTASATLTITHNAAGTPQTVTLAGTATPVPQGRIALGALSLSFPATQVGTPVSQSITVQNTGDAALTFASFTFGGAAAADYARSGTCSAAAPLAPGAQCTLGVTFTPSAVGTRNASLTIASDASNGAATVALAGSATPIPAPAVTLNPTTLAFAEQTIGGLYPRRSVTVTNSGTAALSGIDITTLGTGFSNASTAPCPATLAAGASCTVDIAFAPLVAGVAYEGQLRVASNAAGSPHVATLTGSGITAAQPVLVWQPLVAALDFGSVVAGTVSAPQSLTLLNRGPGGAKIVLLNAVGPDSATFSVTAGTCVVGDTLAADASCTLEVRFAPGAAGARTATVQVASSGSAPTTVALAGTGLGGPSPALALSAGALAFNTVRVGTQSLPQELTLSGSGSGVVRVLGIEASAGYTVQMKSCPTPPFALPAGAECTVTLNFNPTAEGSAAGKLTVTSDATPATNEVALSGTGEPQADLSGGGCSIARGDRAADPTLWLLLLGALAALAYRRRGR